MAHPFLQAEWRNLVMVNYSVNGDLLHRYLPAKTGIDLWNNTCYVSLVGFMFQNTKVKGFKIPFHVNFEEVNLRFYVRHNEKRGVVFIKEIVPKPALTFVANTLYKENYQTFPMDHRWNIQKDSLEIEYSWKSRQWNRMRVLAENNPQAIEPGSEAEFITEHYWGYTKIGDSTSEYEVAHPSWSVYPVKEFSIDVEFGAVYGPTFEFLKDQEPKSVFLAQGSEISVMGGKVI